MEKGGGGNTDCGTSTAVRRVGPSASSLKKGKTGGGHYKWPEGEGRGVSSHKEPLTSTKRSEELTLEQKEHWSKSFFRGKEKYTRGKMGEC